MSSTEHHGERYRLGTLVVTQPVGEEMVVLDMESGLYHSLNEVGALIYAQLRDGATRRELIEAVTERFEVAAETAERDVDAFLRDEIDGGMVQVD